MSASMVSVLASVPVALCEVTHLAWIDQPLRATRLQPASQPAASPTRRWPLTRSKWGASPSQTQPGTRFPAHRLPRPSAYSEDAATSKHALDTSMPTKTFSDSVFIISLTPYLARYGLKSPRQLSLLQNCIKDIQPYYI